LAQVLGGKPIYSQLLHRTMKKEKLRNEVPSEVSNT
jgi:chloride channel protein, CIC family